MNEEDLPEVSKGFKIIAASKGLLLIMCIIAAASCLTGTLVLLYQIRTANEELIDCIVPYGQCYQEKAASLNNSNIIRINVATAYCQNITGKDASFDVIENCVYKEMNQ